LMNRTGTSAIAKLAPPGCRLPNAETRNASSGTKSAAPPGRGPLSDNRPIR
jgi:hypothetical protein